MDFEKELIDDRTMTDLTRQKQQKPLLRKGANDLYFDSIQGSDNVVSYCKDTEAREDIEDIEELIGDIGTEWQPLEDGYSNFWFELTNDTLSPWLNFSAKTENAVIDWGDGSGEQALTTLTPTHTYSKAGKYVVKVKGVTEIARQHSTALTTLTPYVYSCKAIELSNEITNISETYAFCNMFGLEHFYASASFSNVGRDLFAKDFNLKDAVIHFSDVLPLTCFNATTNLLTIDVGNSITAIGNNSVYYCHSLKEFTIPSSVTSIGDSVFSADAMLKTIHCQPTTPPTLGNNVFYNIPSDFIVYVPVGYGDTYKAAEGWSTYAYHILEEGQTPNRAMLAKFNSAKTDEPQDDMR